MYLRYSEEQRDDSFCISRNYIVQSINMFENIKHIFRFYLRPKHVVLLSMNIFQLFIFLRLISSVLLVIISICMLNNNIYFNIHPNLMQYSTLTNSFIGPSVDAHEITIFQRTKEATTNPRQYADISCRGESRSIVAIFA